MYPVKLNQKKKDRIRETEIKYYQKKYLRKRATTDYELPDYLKDFVEPLPLSDVKAIAKKVLDGTFDDKKEVDWLNTITYQNLPKHKKHDFRHKFLKHIPLHVLNETEEKAKEILAEKERKQAELEA